MNRLAYILGAASTCVRYFSRNFDCCAARGDLGADGLYRGLILLDI